MAFFTSPAPISVFLRNSLLVIALVVSGISAQTGPSWTATPFNPPSLPLAVRSPYLNTWVQQGNSPSALSSTWPRLWTSSITGWYASILVDDSGYMLMGSAVGVNVTKATQKSVEFTPTRTSFIMTAGAMDVNLTFISPIEPDDLVRQSLPFSYFTMSATSNDGNSHSVRLYSDISGEFIAGDTSKIAQWAFDDQSGNYIILSMQLQTQQRYAELNDHAQDATEYYALKKISGATVSWSISEDTVNRNNAVNTSVTALNNTADSTPRAVGNEDWPVLGIAVDWGTISSTPEPAVYAIGVVRSPSILYNTPGGTQVDRYPYFSSAYSDTNTAVKDFLDDFDRADNASVAFDASISSLASSISSQYADLIALSVRQVMGSMDITISKSGSGWDTSDVMIFMKNMGGIGSDGGAQTSVNTVDVIYNAFPTLLSLNPELGGYLLAPLMEYMDSSAYTLSYAAMNLGLSYPQATSEGINNAHDYGIEETANMLIMNLAYAQTSGNGTFISQHYTRLRLWADYLVNSTLTPTNQKSSDFQSDSSLANNNQTNTALKGIIGIGAFAKIASLAGVDSDNQQYNATATSYMQTWQSNAVASDSSHVDFFYGKSDTNGLIYNVYADKLLQLDLVPSSVYDVLTVFYNNVASQNSYGIPLNNEDAAETSAHAMLLSASIVTNSDTRNYIINQVHGYASSNRNNTSFTPTYNPTSGYAINSGQAGINSPAVGAMFSILALNVSIKDSISLPSEGSTIPSGSTSTSKKSNIGAIAGGVVGGLAGLGLIVFAVFFFMRRRHQDTLSEKHAYSETFSASNKSMTTGGVPGLSSQATYEPFRYNNTAESQTGSSNVIFPSPFSPTKVSTQSGSVPLREASNGVHQIGATNGATNVRDSTYFRSHRPGESGSDIGPSASQVGSAVSSGSYGRGQGGSQATSSGMSRTDATSPQQVLLAKQTLVNEELRHEVDNLRRDLERIREERGRDATLDDAPPQYTDP